MLHIYAADADKERRAQNCWRRHFRPFNLTLRKFLLGAGIILAFTALLLRLFLCQRNYGHNHGVIALPRPYLMSRPYVQTQYRPQPYYRPQQPYDGPPAAPLPPPSQQPSQGIGGHIYARPWAGSYIFIKGEIVPDDDQTFESLHPPEPVFVRPIGPGGDVVAALGIADTIAQRGYSTLAVNTDGLCGSACATIWLSGGSSGGRRSKRWPLRYIAA